MVERGEAGQVGNSNNRMSKRNGLGSLLLKLWGLILFATALLLYPFMLAKLGPLYAIEQLPFMVFFAPILLLLWAAGISITLATVYVKLRERKSKGTKAT